MSAPRRTTTAEVHGNGSPTVDDVKAAIQGLPGKGRFTFSKVSDQRESSWKIVVTWNQDDEKQYASGGLLPGHGPGVRGGGFDLDSSHPGGMREQTR